MASIVIFVNGVSSVSGSNDVSFGGYARTSDMGNDDPSIYWTAQASPTDLAATINSNIKDAAITAVGIYSHSVGLLDKKTILGGAVGL